MPVQRPRAALLAVLCLSLVAALCLALSATAPPARAAGTPVVDLTGDFESGIGQWAPRGSETVTDSTAVAHQGTHSLAVTDRTDSWQGPSLSLLGTMRQGTAYTLAVWVRLAADSPDTPVRLSVERQWQGTANYETVASGTTATSNGWVQLSGSYTLAADADVLKVYVESVSGTPSFYIDDFSMTHLPAVPVQQDIPALKDALAADFTVGAAVTRAEIVGDHADLLKKHFGSITPGNAMKWDATEPTEGAFNFTDSDAIVDFATANGIKVRGHTLAWYNQTPDWVFKDADGNTMTATPANKALLLSRLENHITAVVGRYKGKIYAWDVANEVIDESQSDGLRRSLWYQITGTDFIADAFRTAHAVDPSAELCINDYNTTVPARRDALYNLVSTLKAQGVPIDCIGHQMHSNIQWPSASDTKAAIEKFAQLGVDQQITEMDVSIYTDDTSSYASVPAAALTQQATEYQTLFDVYRSHSADISSVTLWGLADDNTWLDSFPINRLDAPLLFDRELQAKAAYWSIVGQPTTPPTTTPPTTVPPTTLPPIDPPEPAAPTGLTVTGTTADSVSLSWTAPMVGAPVTGYDIYRGSTRVGGTTTTSYIDTGLTAGTTYSYTVRSHDAAGNPSLPSAAVTATTKSGSSTGGCTASYHVDSDWGAGFTATVTVGNTGSAAITSWKVGWSWAGNQKITNAWNANATQTGTSVTATSMSYNGVVAPGANTTFGFQGTNTGANTAPTLTCTAG
ncbi:endo-1,4-beta-xylanase [Streptomyces sp. NPDC092296]|uniref:endo-1,4-beta-xylanase n=1 Tax=Streptomyces sp. NPDC092296 TaxID=3366012 RepID=UPI00380CFF88